ncbi:MAG TPA: radical SAM protein [Verrucomicrobiae bacterium]|nr:radical SAM protein [Verrucomicrobiae bacterium]
MGAGLDNHELRLLFWETTAGCNLECIHCRRLDVSKDLMKNDLTTVEAFQFVRHLAEFAKPILVLSGGEPLFRPDIFQIAACARDAGLPVALATNGTLIDEHLAHAIVDCGIRRVAISIDGADETTHDEFRRQSGSLAAALRGFRNLRRLGMSMQINCTITNHNVHQIEQLYSLALELGADALHLFMLVPVGCGVQIAQSNMLPAEQYERVLNWMYDKTKLGEVHLKATCAPHYFRVMRQRLAEERRERNDGQRAKTDGRAGASFQRRAERSPASTGNHQPSTIPHPPSSSGAMAAMTKGCLAGSAVCFVSHTGEVFPCGYLPVSAGNVKRKNLRDIWNDSEVFARLRDVDQLEGKCGLCEFKRICLGCRARAFHAAGDYMAEEPFCVYEPKRMHEPAHLFGGI